MGVGMVTGPFRSLPLLGAEFLSVPNWGWSWGMGLLRLTRSPMALFGSYILEV